MGVDTGCRSVQPGLGISGCIGGAGNTYPVRQCRGLGPDRIRERCHDLVDEIDRIPNGQTAHEQGRKFGVDGEELTYRDFSWGVLRIVRDLRDPDQSRICRMRRANIRQGLSWDGRAAEGWILELDGACNPMDVGRGQEPGSRVTDVVAGQPVGPNPGRG